MNTFDKTLIVIWVVLAFIGVFIGSCLGKIDDNGFWICMILMGLWLTNLIGRNYGE